MRNKIEFINFKLQVATFQQINDWTLPLNEFIILKKKKKKHFCTTRVDLSNDFIHKELEILLR